MQALVIFAVLYFFAAAILGVVALNDGSLAMFSLAVAGALAGVLLLAADRALVRLTEIRDALMRGTAPAIVSTATEAPKAPVELAASYTGEAGSLADLERKLAAMREKTKG
jgi:hypothetical protein